MTVKQNDELIKVLKDSFIFLNDQREYTLPDLTGISNVHISLTRPIVVRKPEIQLLLDGVKEAVNQFSDQSSLRER